ncbi:helix-turn-helix domain-containing protein [Christensenella minuta]|uniref:helix-turn-helix domain-containing protein n=1 Tax=Christensenella minuta TaxID=626937 RepID=UPI002157209D|nr:helix-turn-helix domain-containing protein [Christensenella minuta]
MANTQMIPDKRTYRVEEIAEILDIGRATAYSLAKQGCFKTVKIGKVIRISKKSFDEWLDNHAN